MHEFRRSREGLRSGGSGLIVASLLLLFANEANAIGQAHDAQPIGSPAAWFSSSDYPPVARRLGKQGRVAFTVDVDSTGTVTGCHVTGTSGSSLLDDGTCSVLLANGHFKPATDAAGKPIAGHWSSATRWSLGDDLNPYDLTDGKRQIFTFTAVVTVDPEGKVVSCSAPDVDGGQGPCDIFPKGKQVTGPITKEGMPSSAILTFTSGETIQPAPKP